MLAPMKANDILATIGNTPHIRINRLFGTTHEVWVKSERSNPGGSIKDRIGLSMVEDAERSGKLKPGGTIIEPTSGNTGVGLAMVAAVKGYRLVLVMPESMSHRATQADAGLRRELRSDAARERHVRRDRSGRQNWSRKRRVRGCRSSSTTPPTSRSTCAPPRRRSSPTFPTAFDALITGVGTGGHITGCARVLKQAWPELKVFAVEPAASPVISGGSPAPHPIQGIGAGFIPANLDTSLLDGIVKVDADASREMARRAAREEGMLVGISSGATLAAIAQTLPALPAGARVLGFNYDTGERYLSVEGFLPVE